MRFSVTDTILHENWRSWAVLTVLGQIFNFRQSGSTFFDHWWDKTRRSMPKKCQTTDAWKQDDKRTFCNCAISEEAFKTGTSQWSGPLLLSCDLKLQLTNKSQSTNHTFKYAFFTRYNITSILCIIAPVSRFLLTFASRSFRNYDWVCYDIRSVCDRRHLKR